MKNKTKLILLRHGQSIFNQKNIFTGWVDVPLSSQGVQEALEAGKKMQNVPIDIIFTSSLVRAQSTALLAMSQHGSDKIAVIQHEMLDRLGTWSTVYNDALLQSTIPVYRSWHLNERMYGCLQGFNKDEMRKKYGEEKVHMWRRSYDIAPPEGESLQDTAQRTLPYFEREIVPFLQEGRNVFIAAHGNSLRAIVMQLEELSSTEVVSLEIGTGEPMIYTFEQGKFIRQ